MEAALPVVITPDHETRALWPEWPESTFTIPARILQKDSLSWDELLGQR